jgi:hypothetical protein
MTLNHQTPMDEQKKTQGESESGIDSPPQKKTNQFVFT